MIDDLQALDEATELLRGLVSVPTTNPPGDTTGAVAFLAERARAEGLTVEIIGDAAQQSVLLVAGTEGPTLVLNAHLDTVPVVDAADWDYPPFEGRVVDGHMYGRGAADNKAGVTAAFMALLSAHRAGWIKGFRLCGMFVADEETGGAKGTGAALASGMLERLQVAAAIVCDGSGLEGGIWGIRVASKGVARLGITVEGVSAHSARPEQGKNAVLALADVLLALDSASLLPPIEHPRLGPPSMVVGTTIQGGTSPNAVPGRAEATVDCRLVPGVDLASLLERCEELASTVASRRLCTSRVSLLRHQPPIDTDTSQPIVRYVLEAIEEVTGQTPMVRGLVGGNDAKFFIQHGVPTLLGLSPSDASSSRAHGRNENVSLRNVVAASKIYGSAVRKWASDLQVSTGDARNGDVQA